MAMCLQLPIHSMVTLLAVSVKNKQHHADAMRVVTGHNSNHHRHRSPDEIEVCYDTLTRAWSSAAVDSVSGGSKTVATSTAWSWAVGI